MKKIYFVPLLVFSLILVACGKQESNTPATPSAPAVPSAVTAPASAESAASSPVVAANDDNALGQSTFKKVCFMCRATGLNGAPKAGDKTAWGPRIAQSKDLLYRHALEGFTGNQGTMPPRGGSTLSDAEIKAGVDYIVSLAQH